MAILATAVWRARPSGNNANGGGYDPGIAGAATDYSQQNAAQATGTVGTASGTTTFTDAGGAFTAAMVGNALWIASGAGFTVGAYFIVTFNSSTSVVLDRSPGTGTTANWAVGGAWADWFTNPSGANNPMVDGNICYILGSGTPNPSSYVYDYQSPGAIPTLPTGSITDGALFFLNDPATPGYKTPPDTTGGMPTTRLNNFVVFTGANVQGLWIVSQNTNIGIQTNAPNPTEFFGCVIDQFGNTSAQPAISDAKNLHFIASEIFSSVGGSGTLPAILLGGNTGLILNSNIHDTTGPGVKTNSVNVFNIAGNIIAKCGGKGIFISGVTSAATGANLISGNIIDANTGSAIDIDNQAGLTASRVYNNIITNHVTGGTFGLSIDVGSTAQNNAIKFLTDYNSYYNNASNYSGISASPHDTALGVTPYVGQATENYTLA